MFIIEWLCEPDGSGVPKLGKFQIGADMEIKFVEAATKVFPLFFKTYPYIYFPALPNLTETSRIFCPISIG